MEISWNLRNFNPKNPDCAKSSEYAYQISFILMARFTNWYFPHKELTLIVFEPTVFLIKWIWTFGNHFLRNNLTFYQRFLASYNTNFLGVFVNWSVYLILTNIVSDKINWNSQISWLSFITTYLLKTYLRNNFTDHPDLIRL